MMNLAMPIDLMTTGHHHHHHQQQQQQQQQQQHHQQQQQLAAAAAAAAAVAGHHHHSQHHHHHHTTRLYNSPPPISNSDPTVNDCKLIEYRGKKLVSFTVTGEQMLCLPQAVDLFLKNYVGGPHTVYCKLKRLDIVPLVCNTEQIRILRGLGVLQPGVNRCKLLSCKDFDILLDDCENASSRPGRPPKRGPLGLPMPADYLGSNQLPQLKKHRLDTNNTDYSYENGHILESSRLDKSALLAAAAAAENSQQINQMASFMHLNSFPSIMSRMVVASNDQQLSNSPRFTDEQIMAIKDSTRNDMEAIIRSGLWSNNNYQTQYEDMVKHLERLKEEREDCSNRSSNSDQKPLKSFLHEHHHQQPQHDHHIDLHEQQQLSPILNLSKSNPIDLDGSSNSEKSISTTIPLNTANSAIEIEQFDNQLKSLDHHHQNVHLELNNNERSSRPTSSLSQSQPIPPLSPNRNSQDSAPVSPAQAPGSLPPVILEERTFSMEVLLRNIQALLKIATDNAMQHEKQTIYEKTELKMDVLREKEFKDSIEKQLIEERKLRVLYQKRYRKERKLRTRLG